MLRHVRIPSAVHSWLLRILAHFHHHYNWIAQLRLSVIFVALTPLISETKKQ
ncbi:hypothetical protein WUBG_13548, partial [Wuchereria bancrofti]